MQTAFISYQSSRVHYSYCGSGASLLLCLHGYGESEKSFHFLEKHLPAGYTMVAVDLPFHGLTDWSNTTDFTAQDLLSIIHAICTALNIAPGPYTVAGYSMGGRLALSLLQSQPAQTHKLLLLAPDGLKVNFWYRIATRTYIGNRLFYYTMRHPAWLMYLLKAGRATRLINQSIYKFARYYVHDAKVRMELYHRWTSMRMFRPSLSTIKSVIRQNDIPVRLLFGQYDRIIRHERGEKFRKGIESFCTLRIIQSGHQVLHEKHAAVFIDLLQS